MHVGPHHGHSHGNDDRHLKLNRSFAIAVVLNIMLVVGEAVGGLLSGSVALLADAGHNLSDVAGLILAWWAHWLRGTRRRGRWTYGKRSFTILAANINAILLVIAIVGVSIEAIKRLFHPSEIAEIPVLAVALFATLLNFGTARLLAHGGNDLNVRGAYLHMLADAAVSLAVVLGALLILVTDWHWIDPVISLAICVVLSLGTWQLLRESTSLMMQAAPKELDLDAIREYLQSFQQVQEIGDFHVWSASTTDVLLTAKLFCPSCSAEQHDELLHELHEGLHSEFGIMHSTIEVLRGGNRPSSCALDPQ